MKYKWYFLSIAAILSLSLVILTVSLLWGGNQKGVKPKPTGISLPTPTRSTTQIVPGESPSLQKTVIGKTRTSEVERLPNIIKKETLPNGQVAYSLKSELIPRPNLIIAEKGVVVFERALVPQNPAQAAYLTISEVTNRHGTPDRVIQGSHFYDWVAHTYIYSQKGVAIIGNPNTNEVFELHVFQPMPVDSYIQQYGQDLNPGAQPETLIP